MSQCTIEWAMGRIKTAREESPIAVFRVPGSDLVNAVFESTVLTRHRVDIGDDLLIGVFHTNMGEDWVRQQLEEACR